MITLVVDSLLKMMQSQLMSLGGIMEGGNLQRLKEREQQPADHQSLQARIVQLEAQVCQTLYVCCLFSVSVCV